MTWTTERVLALLADPVTARDGQALAGPLFWRALGRAEGAIWGEYPGSAATAYRTQIDLRGTPAYQCSCSSSKFPCKHAAGLFLLHAAQPDLFAPGEPPDWVASWLAAHTARPETEQPQKLMDTKAQAQRAAKREAKVAAGVREIALWLRDLVRRGIAYAAAQPPDFWEASAARMIDAQAPGIARRIRAMAAVPQSGEGWPERLLEHIARLHLLVSGYTLLDSLPPGTQADIRAAIGFTERQENLLKQPGVSDRWLVLGYREDSDEKLRTRRTWLLGLQSGRMALHLAYRPELVWQPFNPPPPVGPCFDGELVYFPSAYPLRASVKAQVRSVDPPEALPPGYADTVAAMGAYAAALACNPWIERFPLLLDGVIPASRGDFWVARDGRGRALPLLLDPESAGESLLALSGGYPISVFGEWGGRIFLPLSVFAERRLVYVDH